MNIIVNNINFQAKINTKLVRNAEKTISDQQTRVANELVSRTELSMKPIVTRADKIAEQKSKAEKIKKIINKCINANGVITIPEISKKTKIPLNQVVTIIYRNSFPEIKEMFDRVKDSTRLEKPLTEKTLLLTERMTKDAAENGISYAEDGIIEAEKDYIDNLAQLIHKAEVSRTWSKDAIERFSECFKDAPAFADMLISTKNKKNRIRSCTSFDLMQLIFDTHKINPELTEELVCELDEGGNFKYTSYIINKIVAVADKYPELINLAKKDTEKIYWLASKTDEKGNQYLTANEIEQIYTYLEKYPDITKRLFEEKITVVKSYGKEKNTATSENMPKSNPAEEVNEEILKKDKKVIKIPKYRGDQVLYILKQYETNPEFVKALLDGCLPWSDSSFSGRMIVSILREKDLATRKHQLWEESFNVNGKMCRFSNKKELSKMNKCLNNESYNLSDLYGWDKVDIL